MVKPKRISNFIGGAFVPYEGNHLDSFEPCTGEVWAQIPDSGPEEVNNAVQSAMQAFERWSGTPAKDRCAIMMKIADLLEENLDEFAQAESRDQGKTIQFARTVDIPRAVYNFRFFATTILHQLDTSTYMDAAGAINYTCKQPVGVAGLISPWNLPLYLLTFKMAPAMAAGNTIVAKPSEMTSVTAWMLCDICNRAGVPPGVVNMVFGTGSRAGDALVRHPDVPLISFTGGTATAKLIRKATSSQSKKLSLELGGKNAAIVFADADLPSALPALLRLTHVGGEFVAADRVKSELMNMRKGRSAFANQGEICLCTSRIFVQDKIYDNFLEKFVELTRNMKVGDPTDPDVRLGALISKEHLAKVTGFVEYAKEEGATIHCGYGVEPLKVTPPYEKGYFMPPTVISGVTDSSRVMQEEIFGPVVCILPFTSEEDAIARANNTMYGLCASVWTKDVSVGHRICRKLQVGTAWMNCWLLRDLNMPFGGTKQSGTGREGFKDSMEFFTEVKTICVKI